MMCWTCKILQHKVVLSEKHSGGSKNLQVAKKHSYGHRIKELKLTVQCMQISLEESELLWNLIRRTFTRTQKNSCL